MLPSASAVWEATEATRSDQHRQEAKPDQTPAGEQLLLQDSSQYSPVENEEYNRGSCNTSYIKSFLWIPHSKEITIQLKIHSGPQHS